MAVAPLANRQQSLFSKVAPSVDLLAPNTRLDIDLCFAINTGPFVGLARHNLSRVATWRIAVYAKHRLQLNVNNGAVVDVTVHLSIPQMEQGGQASSPILPAVGTPGATTRAVDQARVHDLSLTGAFTLLVQGSVSGTGTQVLVLGGIGPNNDFPNSSYFTIDTTGYGAWTALAGAAATARAASLAGSVRPTSASQRIMAPEVRSTAMARCV